MIKYDCEWRGNLIIYEKVSLHLIAGMDAHEAVCCLALGLLGSSCRSINHLPLTLTPEPHKERLALPSEISFPSTSELTTRK